MARKHGFRGTPVKPSGIPSSVGGIFEKRGDPMVSPREGREKFGRNLETENPDFDRYFADRQRAEELEKKSFENLARDLLKPSQVDTGNAFRKLIAKPNYDPQRKAASILQKMHIRMRNVTVNVKASKNKSDPGGRDNIPATVAPTSKKPSREKQTPKDLGHHEGFYDFSGKLMPKEIKKHGKIYRRK